ncbi:MAG: MBL fold metallo-hydrolase [Bacteroidales bacterium]|nr:MBL fold metallo-hydrolase [Bacteroidales bacterium]
MNYSVTHFKVGNGNCCVIKSDNFVMIVDLNKTDDKESSYELLKPFFRQKDGVDTIDVLYITHGDEDHCLGFGKFKKEIDEGNLKIGSIWHQNYDKEKYHDPKKDPALSESYLALNKEIKRRKELNSVEFGDIQKALKAKDDNTEAFEGLDEPENFQVKVISPVAGDDEDSVFGHNDLSLIIKFEIEGKSMLFTGDTSSKYWQERIIPEVLDIEDYEDWAKAEVLEVGHHGSYDFFGQDRASVREADEPGNYEALDRIAPDDLIISSEFRFPTSKDASGDQPPHYAAWKWYHKWFRENHSVKEHDKHPDQFNYTSEGNLRLEFDGVNWKWIKNWDHNKDENQAQRLAEKMKHGGVAIGSGDLISTSTKYYGEE